VSDRSARGHRHIRSDLHLKPPVTTGRRTLRI